MKSNERNRKPWDKCFAILRIVVSAAAIVFAALQLFDVWDQAIHLAAPLMGVVLLLQGVQEWKSRRGIAVFSICCAVFVFVCAVVVWFL